MRRPSRRDLCFVFAAFSGFLGCGARSSLPVEGSEGGAGGSPVVVPTDEGAVEPCGTDVGVCVAGKKTFKNGAFGECVGEIPPMPETCNGLDDNCDGQVDEGFGIGEACDGADTDLCNDDVMSCGGCSKGPNNVELCNGVDDNCNGIVDADCEVGDCKPTLNVTGSTPSSPSCIDFPVEAGSVGVIEFPCGGGAVTAQLGAISFTGTVENGVVSLHGTATVNGPDDCTWKTDHFINGTLSQGFLTYSYEEAVIAVPPPIHLCWNPCTESGNVKILWGQ